MKISQTEMRQLNWGGLKARIASVLAFRGVNFVVQFAARRLLPPRIAHRLPLSIRHVSYRLEDGQEVRLLDPGQDIVARDIHWGGEQPTSAAEQGKFRCIERLSKNCATFIDIGAYGGVCALVAARSNPRLKSLAFEIVPQNFLLLVRNILENDLATRIDARLVGIGATHGTVRLPLAMGLASNPTSMSIGSSFSEGVKVNVVPLDDATAELKGPFLVKIDVEGYESDVFKGSTTFLSHHKPDIICEILPDASAACTVIDSLLSPLGYRRYMFGDAGLVEHQTLIVDTIGRDWLFTTRNDVGTILDFNTQLVLADRPQDSAKK